MVNDDIDEEFQDLKVQEMKTVLIFKCCLDCENDN